MKAAFPPIVDKASKILILGTMPGEKSLALQQYYGNRQNQFWKLIFTVFDAPLDEDYKRRLSFLKQKRIALWDVLAMCSREGSLDSNIKDAVANDFDSFYRNHPNISTVFFSSKAAEKFYIKLVGKREGISYHVLPSPSGANATKSFLQKLESWSALKMFVD